VLAQPESVLLAVLRKSRVVRYLTGQSGFLVQGPVDNSTQYRTGESPVFSPGFILTSLKLLNDTAFINI